MVKKKTVRLSIAGMSCAGCVASVEKALQSVEGVEEALVNFAEHTADVTGTASIESIHSCVKPVRRFPWAGHCLQPECWVFCHY